MITAFPDAEKRRAWSRRGCGSAQASCLLSLTLVTAAAGQPGGQCLPSSPPTPILIRASVGGELVALTSNRMIGMNAGDPGQTQGIKIRFVDLPTPFHVWNGSELWVEEPTDVCELGGVGVDDPCPEGVGFLKVSGLTCDIDEAHFTDWSEVGTFYLRHAGLIPEGLYELRVVDGSCDPADELTFSLPLVVRNSKFGDICGPFDPEIQQWVAPDGEVNITSDVLAAIDAFSNRTGNVTKLRADLKGVTGFPPGWVACVQDMKVGIDDITMILHAFEGQPLPYGPSMLDAHFDPTCVSDPCDG